LLETLASPQATTAGSSRAEVKSTEAKISYFPQFNGAGTAAARWWQPVLLTKGPLAPASRWLHAGWPQKEQMGPW
jgi:hypothetical protein